MLSIQPNISVDLHWKVTEASILVGSAIGLVTMWNDVERREARSRIDVGKLVLLDPLPVDVSKDIIWQIADGLGRMQRADVERTSAPRW